MKRFYTMLMAGIMMVAPSTDFYVNDLAGVLSADTEQVIMENSPALAQATGAQIAVLTVESLQGLDSHDFAYRTATDWGLGDKEKDNGLLILLAPNEGEIWVEVGYGLEGALNDAKVGRYIDTYAMEAYQNGDFDTGTVELYRALLSAVMVEYGLDALPGYQPLGESSSSLPGGMIALIIIVVLLFLMNGRGGRRHYRSGPPFGGFGGFGGPPRGGFGGGSGGFGGGGGFHGGGGGFGGGGAGRSFK